MISGSNEQLQQELEYTPTKPWLSQLVNFKHTNCIGLADTLQERYAIEFCFKLGKNARKLMEYFRLILQSCMNQASVF